MIGGQFNDGEKTLCKVSDGKNNTLLLFYSARKQMDSYEILIHNNIKLRLY